MNSSKPNGIVIEIGNTAYAFRPRHTYMDRERVKALRVKPIEFTTDPKEDPSCTSE